MAKNITDLKKELNSLQYEIELMQKIDCSKEDNKKYRELSKQGLPLPEGVYAYKTETGEDMYQYYTIHIATELSKEERIEYIMLKQFQNIKTIKNCVLFFTILTAISLIVGFLQDYKY